MNSQECERELPKPGEKWRHFKGGEYWVILVASLINSESSNSEILASEKRWVVYSKSGILPLRIFSTEDSSVFRLYSGLVGLISKTDEAWKESEVKDSTIWARPLHNFMETLSSPHGDQSSNYYRFERECSR